MIVISHNSALEYLRSVPPQARGDNRTTTPIAVPGIPGRTEIGSFDSKTIGVRQAPLHILTSRSDHESRARGVVAHRTSLATIPRGLLLEAGNDVYVCGPELVFAQLASALSDIGLIVLGYELCGSYSHFAPLVSGFYDRPALTTKGLMHGALDALSGQRFSSVARNALDLVLEGSASPMETVTANMLFLPGRLGGLGLVMPQLNHEIPLDDVGQAITGTRTCVADGAWVNLRRGFEYNGSDHTDPAKDRDRLEALAHEGYSMYTIDAGRMMRFSELRKVTRLIEDDIPRRRGQRTPTEEAMQTLHRRLLAATRCGLGLEAALFGVPVRGCGIRTHL